MRAGALALTLALAVFDCDVRWYAEPESRGAAWRASFGEGPR